MATASVIRAAIKVLLSVALLVGLLVSLHLMSGAVQNEENLNQLYIPLLIFNILGLLILLVVISVSLARLIRAYRANRPGARLTMRMVSLFVLLSLLPVAVVYFYSMQYLLRGIDGWFDVQIDQAMQDSLSLGKASMDLQKRYLLHQTQELKSEVAERGEDGLIVYLGELRGRSGATELTVLDANGHIIASRNINPGILMADTPNSAILGQVASAGAYVGLTPYGDEGLLHLRVVVMDRIESFFLQGIFPTPERISGLSDKVQGAFEKYQRLSYLQKSLKITFSLALLLVLLFSFFTAVWAAIYSARRLLAPLIDLGEATKSVAEGDYTTRLPARKGRDEVEFLVSSFNAMTLRIGHARDVAANSQKQVEDQRAYLQTVLEHLSTGVIAFSSEGDLRTVNSAAGKILAIPLENRIGCDISSLANEEPLLKSWLDRVQEIRISMQHEQQGQESLDTYEGRKILRWRTTPLIGAGGPTGALVLMFDDITDLLRAQRESAWGEVARRLAHEIKNPLTPIQLSAERLRRKYLQQLDDSDVLDRATNTIIQQVEAMKRMVNAFSDYARPSKLEKESLVFDQLLRAVVGLYGAEEGEISLSLQAGDARMYADPVKLRQVVHNLIKNAQEAVHDQQQRKISISSRSGEHKQCHFIELEVVDSGSGFDTDLLERVFDPYVTTKQKGTGLGLAIVRKIIDEHGGGIWVMNLPRGGARVIVRLPEERSSQEICRHMPPPSKRESE
jgi:nitrogen fixation/metabolism regulation signal transduction histidine kinase